MNTPTQSDRAEFRAFCRNATLAQLAEIEAKERRAGRLVYAEIAAAVAEARQ